MQFFYSLNFLSQYLYQVKNTSFNNATVTRYMVFTLLRLGSLEEAKYALRAYLDLMGIPDFDSGIVLDDGSAEETINPDDKDSATELAPPVATKKKAYRIIRRLPEQPDESVDSVVQVILAGIQLYGHEEQNGSLAAYLSDLALDLLLQSQITAQLAQVYRARGSAYGLLAAQSEEHSDRAIHHEESIKSLKKSAELDDKSWRTHYVLGLQQAVMRDTHAAILSVSKSIEIHPHHVDSWHLLALLYSCKRTDNLPKALKTLEAGLQLSMKTFPTASGLPVFSWNEEESNANDIYKQAESYISIRMSQLTLQEAMEGPESVIDQYEELFTLYSQITQQLGVCEPGEEINTPATPSSPSSTGGRRRRKSSLSLIRRTSLTSIANSISSSVSTGTTRRRSSSVEETNTSRPPVPRRAESDTDDFSDDSSITASTITSARKSSTRRRHRHQPPPPSSSSSVVQRSNSAIQSEAELKKRSLQLIDLGLARRIGTAAAGPAQHSSTGKPQGKINTLTAFVSLTFVTNEYNR